LHTYLDRYSSIPTVRAFIFIQLHWTFPQSTYRKCWKQPAWEARPWATANVRDSYSVWWAHQPQKSTSVLLLFLVVSGMAASLCSLNLLEAAPNVCTVTCAACCSQFGIGACLHLNSIPHDLASGCLFPLLVFLLLNSWLELQYYSNTSKLLLVRKYPKLSVSSISRLCVVPEAAGCPAVISGMLVRSGCGMYLVSPC
jgi:hypothetical protein